MSFGAGKHPLVMMSDRSPLDPLAAGSLFGRAHGALMNEVVRRRGVWLAASETAVAAAPGSWLRRVAVDAQTLQAHREGHCETTLAAAYFGHRADPVQQETWLRAHREVSSRYASQAARLAAPGAAVWLHGYHLQLVPAMLRRLRSDLRIGLVLHSPFPSAEAFAALAGREDIIRGLLDADVLAFTEARSAANFANVALDGPAEQFIVRPITTMVMPMPAETKTIVHLAADRQVQAAAARLRRNLHPAGTVFLSVGSGDPADGSAHRLREFAALLAAGDADPRRHAYIHLSSAADVPGAQDDAVRAEIEGLVAQINGDFARPGLCPVHYQRQDLSAGELTALYLAADVMLATPMRDRATPHAAEFVAARTSDRGQVILSEFSATASQLPQARIVNPHEPNALARAMIEAARQAHRSSAEMAQMRQAIASNGISQWVQRFLDILTAAGGQTEPVPVRRASARPPVSLGLR